MLAYNTKPLISSQFKTGNLQDAMGSFSTFWQQLLYNRSKKLMFVYGKQASQKTKELYVYLRKTGITKEFP